MKPDKSPIILECSLPLTVTTLQYNKLIKSNHQVSQSITWKQKGENVGSIMITVNTVGESYYAELEYTYNEKLIKYQIRLVTVPANIGGGKIWYFICNETNKRCRKLYLVDGYFVYRKTKGTLYKQQALPMKDRRGYSALHKLSIASRAYNELSAKNGRVQYAGTYTKRYMRYLNITNKVSASNILPIATF